MVDAPRLGRGRETCGGSSPLSRTKKERKKRIPGVFLMTIIL